MFDNINFQIIMELVEISLKVAVTHFVTCFKFAKIVGLLLYCIICEMNKLVTQISKIKFFTTCPDVAILVEVAFQGFVDGSN